jgi:cell division protein ZapA
MQDKLNISINISGKSYSMSIAREQEEIVRRAEKEINRQIASYQSKFRAEKDDYLAVIAMDFAVKALSLEVQRAEDEAGDELRELDRVLGEYLNKLQ